MTDNTTTGRARRAEAQGDRFEAATRSMDAIDPRLAQWADSWIFGEVWADDSLEFQERMLVAITALAATGHQAQLRGYLHGALDAEMDPARIHAALMTLPVYVGFPTALDALVTWQDVVSSVRDTGRDVEVVVQSRPRRSQASSSRVIE